MSTSKTITRTDLTNILNEVLPPMTLNPWVSIFATGFTGNNTATKVTGTTIRSGGSASEYFDTSVSDQVTIKRAGTYKITCYFRTSAITSAGNVKRISCYSNDDEIAVAMSRLNSWEDCMAIIFRDLEIGDVLTMYKRAEDGNSTYAPAIILIEAVNSTTGNISAEADYIVEQGTSGIWTYRKWNSGIAECWGTATVTPTWIAYTISGLYYSSPQSTVSYPFNITNALVLVNPTLVGNNVGWVANVTPYVGSVGFTIVRNGNTGDATVQLSVKGTWK